MNRHPLLNPDGVNSVFLFDVDNTLLDNDRVIADFERHLIEQTSPEKARHYWNCFEELRDELGYVDYLGALQQLRLAYPHEANLMTIARFFLDYPFAERLYPKALDVLAHVQSRRPVALLTDGDIVYQPNKVHRSGLYRAVDGRALVYVHKEEELAEVEARFPADHYVLVDDKLRILTAVKESWGARVTTVFVKQGHYALDPEITAAHPPADVSIERVGDLLRLG